MRPLAAACILLAACTVENPDYDPISAWVIQHPDAGDPFAPTPDLAIARDLAMEDLSSRPDLSTAPDLQSPPDLAMPDLVQLPDLTLVCSKGFADCNHDPADGCEVDLRSDPANCGRCGAHCGPYDNAVADCVPWGACTIAKCNPGWADCNHDLTDGCETPVADGGCP